ncbi:hypothetical protein EYD10_07504 [Varanus komodoensis]|nr:hypothetical protein EYD10_07504 [Varanus komodoensis]
MEDFTTRTYGTRGLDNRPLFGETSPRSPHYEGELKEWKVSEWGRKCMGKNKQEGEERFWQREKQCDLGLVIEQPIPGVHILAVPIMWSFCTRTAAPELEGSFQPPVCNARMLRIGLVWALHLGSGASVQLHPPSHCDRIINLAVGSVTSLLLLVTLISAFFFPQLPPKPVNIFFAFCISLCSVSAGILVSITTLTCIYWYRQGDLEPKFRNLIYYILFSIIMLCICANLYFHEVGK